MIGLRGDIDRMVGGEGWDDVDVDGGLLGGEGVEVGGEDEAEEFL